MENRSNSFYIKYPAACSQQLVSPSLHSALMCCSLAHSPNNQNVTALTVEAQKLLAEQQMGDIFSGVKVMILFSLMKSHTDLTGTNSISGLCFLSGLLCLWNELQTQLQSADSDEICRHNPIRNKRSLSGALRWPQSKPAPVCVCVCVLESIPVPVQRECDLFIWY